MLLPLNYIRFLKNIGLSPVYRLAERMCWEKLAQQARSSKKLSGFYNDNYKLFVDGKACLFRFPIKNAPKMDPRAFQEADVLSMLSGTELQAPEIMYKATSRAFYVEEFIDGFVMEDRCPPGERVLEKFLDQIADFYQFLVENNETDVSPYIDTSWPINGRAEDFFKHCVSFSENVYQQSAKTHQEQYTFLGISHDPYAPLKENAKGLYDRPWRLIHTDLHRGNIILAPTKRICVIDWELALYGDVMLCLASHIHRTRYYDDERQTLIEKVKAKMPASFKKSFNEDLDFYLTFEALKSVITDTVRFPKNFQEERFSAKKEAELCLYFTDNLKKIAPLIGCRTAEPDEALRWFQEW